jgi:hypothetical protein
MPNVAKLRTAIRTITEIERQLEPLRARDSCAAPVIIGKLQAVAEACQDGFDAILGELEAMNNRLNRVPPGH